MITAYQGDQVDAIVQFDVLTGASLFDDANFSLIATPAALHRQIWMRTDTGQFAKKEVRQALALYVRPAGAHPAAVQGSRPARQRPCHLGGLPVLRLGDPAADPGRREGQVAAVDGRRHQPDGDLHAGQLQEIPDLAVLLKSQAAEAGITLNAAAVESLDTFYGAQWCPAEPADPPCSGAAELGIVDYGHRATPDVYLNAALKTKGIWNSSQYTRPAFDAAFTEFQAAVGVDAQKAACTKIETILNEDVPVGLPYFYNYLAGNSNKFTGVFSSALGQMSFSQTSQV